MCLVQFAVPQWRSTSLGEAGEDRDCVSVSADAPFDSQVAYAVQYK